MYITAIAAFFTAYYFVNVAGFHMALKRAFKVQGRLKPFDCVVCLTVWLAVVFYLLPMAVSYFFFTCFFAGFIAIKVK